MAIQDDVTIKPGVTIAFETDAGFLVQRGTLSAKGTADEKITLTGVNKEPGAWAGIRYNTADERNVMQHTIVEYAGGDNFTGSPEAAVVMHVEAGLVFTDNLIQYSAGYGLAVAADVTTSIENNVFSENDIPVSIRAQNVGIIQGNNEFIDNTTNKVELLILTSPARIEGTQTWSRLSVPYFTTGAVAIGIPGDVTIEPGTIIEMHEDAQITVHATGSLKIVGTPDDKIIIRGVVPEAGTWNRIQYTGTDSPNNEITHAEIKHAGSTSNQNNTSGAIQLVNKARLTIGNTLFEDILGCAIHGLIAGQHTDNQENLTISNTNFTNVGGQVCSD